MAQTRFSGPVVSDNGFSGNVTGNVTGTASAVNGAVTLQAFTVATLPTVVVNGIIVVTDANSGAGTVCFGKGTSWIDISTGVAVVA
jgi:sulfite exporter TauE/SafE